MSEKKMLQYKATVVIPVYNAQEYLTQCVESVLNQEMDAGKIEIILVNDGSTDASELLCQSFENTHSNIVYVKKENTGVSDTRNTGIKLARGEYILILDADDYLSPQTIPHLIKFFDEHYDEVDLVTYPIYWDRAGRLSLHARYSPRNYDKGTAVYDLDEYPWLNQSTVNIIFKNLFADNLLYNTSMKLSEDQYFDTCLLMKKNKLGFVREAAYYYRRYGGGVSQTRNNPYYCFDDIMSYNERLLSEFCREGKVPPYIQTLVVNTFTWRVNTDELLPYHYDEKDFMAAKERIAGILKKIDNEVIIKYSNANIYTKLLFLKWKGEKLLCNINNGCGQILLSTGEEFYQADFIECYIYKIKENKGKISLFASFSSPVLELIRPEKYIITAIKKDGQTVRSEFDIRPSKVPFRKSKMKTAATYPFTFEFDPEEIKQFSLKVIAAGEEINTKPVYIQFCGFIKKYHRESVAVGKWRVSCKNDIKDCLCFCISRNNICKDMAVALRTAFYYPKKHILGILYYRLQARTRRKIWLYYDSAGVIDNGYYQFIHDFAKNDGVERYYIADGTIDGLNEKFTKEQQHIVQHKSRKHKILFLKSSKIFASFSSLSIYNPFGNVAWYSDVTHYQLIYLQHGILHASLQRMYAKEYTEIDKFVISSDFEKRNLIENYDYAERDLIMSGMPRMAAKKEDAEVKNKILFAPSWRQYLIGQLVDNRRTLRSEEFLRSDYYIKINNFLHSEKLQNILQLYNLTLDFKLHPIFKAYKEFFKVDELDNINLDFDKTVLEEYKAFITDFSSYQFDFVRLVRPILYFLPDPLEMKAGIHSYRELDLKYEDAFGPLCLTEDELLQELQAFAANGFQTQEPYRNRMEAFFNISDDPSETIYKAVTD